MFEYLDHTLLDELEAATGGLGEDTAKRHLYQLLKGIDYCHQNSVSGLYLVAFDSPRISKISVMMF